MKQAVLKQEKAVALPRIWKKEEASIIVFPKRISISYTKAFFDFVLASLGILLAFPLGVVIALFIFLEDGFPIFYRQERVGKRGKIFYAVKFRTMKPNAEDGVGPVQALPNDPRITRVGKILRRTALDELPQLWNIVKGEMSFVGPRPLRPGEIFPNRQGEHVQLEHVPGFAERCAVTPGLTGLAQVFAPRDIEHRHKFRYDLFYAKKQNFLLDLRLIGLSFLRTFSSSWQL